MKETDLYVPSREVADILNEHGLSLKEGSAHGLWKNPKIHARANIGLITYHYPQMDRECQLRANRTIENLTEQHGNI